ncbi:MAG: VanW family protein [Propionibacteriaceae bacterium]|nr:VanW family protein [Propionibacteriaceae bacterium]
MAKQRSFAWTAAVVIGGLFAVLLGAYLGIHYVAFDHIPTNTVVTGVRIGGMSADQATAVLHEAFDPRTSGEFAINAQGKSVAIDLAQIGASVDYPATLAQVGGGSESWNPLDNLEQLFGGGEHEAVLTLDDAALTEKIETLAAEVDQEPVPATLVILDGAPQVGPGADGVKVDVPASVQAFKAALLRSLMVDAVVEVVEPDITTAEAEQAASEIAVPALASPVQVLVGDAGKIELSTELIAKTLRFEPSAGALLPSFDAEGLNAAIGKDLDKLGLKQPVDAKFTIAGKKSGKPKISKSKDGSGIDIQQLSAELIPMLNQAGVRQVSVDVAPRPAGFSTADAEAMGVKEITGQFTTYFPGSAYRYNNIGKAAKLINGTYLAPGETFSMNKTLGERTRKNGWMAGGGIANGKIDPNIYGGGVSQSTTTTYNAIFFAGLKDIYHKPHSLYFSRYPVGREATLDWKMVDMKFQNDSPHGVLLQAWITGRTGSQGSVTVRVWSTKVYDIKSSTPVRSNYRAPGKPVYDTSAKCVAQSAMSGFDVRFNRLFYQDGKQVKKEPFKWSYNSLTPVICGKKPDS